MGNLTEPVAISLRHWAEGAEPVAAWWSQEGPGGAGGWSSEGCQLRSSQPNVSALHCQHLGNVAVLMVSQVGLGGAGQGTREGGGVEVGLSDHPRPQRNQGQQPCQASKLSGLREMSLWSPPPHTFHLQETGRSCFHSQNERGGPGTTQPGLLRPSLHSPRSRLLKWGGIWEHVSFLITLLTHPHSFPLPHHISHPAQACSCIIDRLSPLSSSPVSRLGTWKVPRKAGSRLLMLHRPTF